MLSGDQGVVTGGTPAQIFIFLNRQLQIELHAPRWSGCATGGTPAQIFIFF
jgi:hypothetical protein